MSVTLSRRGLLGLAVIVTLLQLTIGEIIDLPGLGRIEGTTSQSFWTNRTIYQYHRLPFAETPKGTLRFRRPVKWTFPWTETRNSTYFGPMCPQDADIQKEEAEQDEDCLHLNVYTTKVGEGGVGQGHPVMFYVHGGSFRIGSSRNLPPTYLLEHDVILVTTQYRLGPLGFLSLNTDEVPGNQGMWDIVMALEWVQDNIEHFGGDPSRVTLFGHSAGGAAVTLMLFTPFLKPGLIQRVIGQSGSALGTWVTDPEPVLHAHMIANNTACNETDHEDVVALTACLQGIPAKELVDAHITFLLTDLGSGGRGVGGNHIVYNENGDMSFFPKDPALLFLEGNFTRLPLMTGITKHEGSWFVGNIHDLFLVPQNLTGSSPEAEEFMSMDVTTFVLRYSGIDDRTGYVPSFLQDSYFTDEQLGNFTAMIPGLTDIMGVALLKASTFTLAKAMSRSTDTYLYSFNFFGRFTTFPDYHPFTGGVAHSDELYYLFAKETGLNEREVEMAWKMTQLWTNFAKNGVPTADGVVSWPKMASPSGPYLRIELEPSARANFVRDEYMIAVHEGMTEPEPDKGSAQALQVSLVTTLVALAATLLYKA